MPLASYGSFNASVVNEIYSSGVPSKGEFFQPSHNTKREASDFTELKRLKNTACRRESVKNVVDPDFVFKQIRDIWYHKASDFEINIVTSCNLT